MTVDDFAAVLTNGGLEFLADGQYENEFGQVGYRAIYRNSGRYYWFSVSGTDVGFALDEVAQAIISPSREILRAKPYWNRHLQQGFEATVRSGEHYFMLNVAPDPPRIAF
jgi:hypothetical protein